LSEFASDLTYAFFISLGVVTGGSIIGALACALTGDLPLHTVAVLAERLKIWGMVAALGGTFSTIRNIETGILGGQLKVVAKQSLFLLSAFTGAHMGYVLLTLLAGPKR